LRFPRSLRRRAACPHIGGKLRAPLRRKRLGDGYGCHRNSRRGHRRELVSVDANVTPGFVGPLAFSLGTDCTGIGPSSRNTSTSPGSVARIPCRHPPGFPGLPVGAGPFLGSGRTSCPTAPPQELGNAGAASVLGTAVPHPASFFPLPSTPRTSLFHPDGIKRRFSG
jgi:hypothetical protein